MTRSIACLFVALAGSGCVRAYPQPSIDEPHADVQVRVVHHQELGPEYDERVRIAEWAVRVAPLSPGVQQTTMRVRPEPTRCP